jgi:hypothetical protein
MLSFCPQSCFVGEKTPHGDRVRRYIDATAFYAKYHYVPVNFDFNRRCGTTSILETTQQVYCLFADLTRFSVRDMPFRNSDTCAIAFLYVNGQLVDEIDDDADVVVVVFKETF